ncbi:MAG: type I glyceraldehyde-3-phosphate dehydrogenase [Anaerolineae bacterium]
MTVKIGINGFGRIGRQVFKAIRKFYPDQLEVVAVNDIVPVESLAYLLKYDSVYGRYPEAVEAGQGTLRVGSQEVQVLNLRSPAELPWEELEVGIAIESTGLFTRREDTEKHLQAGAKRVIITAPAKGPDITVCLGVNEKAYDPAKHRVISNASCTTNCLAPVAKVLDEEFGIVFGFLTTVHAFTGNQKLVDGPHKKLRRGRAAADSIVPTTTGAAIATTEVLPQLQGKMDGLAMRVPVLDGSIIDFVAQTEKPVTVEKVNQAFRRAAQREDLKGILDITDEEWVSADVIGTTQSAIVDAPSTMVLGDHMVKVLAWYDNEWGYACRVADLASYIADKGV